MMQPTLLTHGAHLLQVETNTGPLLWISPNAQLIRSKAIRGGVPLIGPWFAELTGQTPSHGWARISTWELNEDGTEARIEHEEWELAAALNAQDDGIKLAYCATNRATTPRRVQLAFHPYFLVGDVRDIAIEGLSGAQLYDRTEKTFEDHHGVVAVEGEFDRIYATDQTEVRIMDPGMGRSITLSTCGSDSFVVWNPGEALAANMPEIRDQWTKFVCVEPALLGEGLQGVHLTPGESRCLSMEVSVKPLAK